MLIYTSVYKLISLLFNILNFLLAGKLPPFCRVCIIVEEQGHYLVIKSRNRHSAFPGGYIRWHEDPISAAQREGKEETGLQLTIGHMVGYYSHPTSHFDRLSTLTICYTGKVVGGELRSSVEGQPYWLDESQLPAKLGAEDQSRLDDYLQSKPGWT